MPSTLWHPVHNIKDYKALKMGIKRSENTGVKYLQRWSLTLHTILEIVIESISSTDCFIRKYLSS